MKTRVITAIVGIIVLIGVMFTFNTLIFNLVIAAITLIAVHEIYSALGFEKKDWLMYAVLCVYTAGHDEQLSGHAAAGDAGVLSAGHILCHLSVVRNGTISYQKASGLLMFSRHRDLLLLFLYPAQGAAAGGAVRLRCGVLYPAILCFAWGGDTCAYFAGRAFGKHKLCPVVSPKRPWKVLLAVFWAPWRLV